MRSGRFAVMDLGTNTFNLVIVQVENHVETLLHTDRISVKIGKGGIQDRKITKDAGRRALDALLYFSQQIGIYKVPPKHVKAIATSAFRNALNGQELVDEIKTSTGIEVQVIQGGEEAEWIYLGVKAALEIGEDPALIMDIGGGSVEFILCNDHFVFWKKSYEIGAQRLLDNFHTEDPIPADQISALNTYLSKHTADLQKALHIYRPKVLIGSSGTFDSLCDMYAAHCHLEPVDYESGSEYSFPLEYFELIFQQVISKNVEERRKISGLIEMRVDMIVVSLCLIKFVLSLSTFSAMRVSFYSLKEGVMYKLISE